MRRREFLGAALAAGVAASSRAADAQQSGRELYELRNYHFATQQKLQAYQQFIAQAAVPAFNRAGIEPVGVFQPFGKDAPLSAADEMSLWILLPHRSMESVLNLREKLAGDTEFRKAGEPILNAPKSEPAFLRYDSMLLLAMEGFPKLHAPDKSPERVFELRTYESHSEDKALNKLKMFNAGEFQIFGQANMPGVFFGGAIIGSDLPQLTYMIVHDEAANVKKHWDAFFGSPDWAKLKGDPSYQDNVSKVIDRFLKPAPGSQI